METPDSNRISGHYEIQVCEGSEGELQKHFRNCTKNPGHHDFVPVHQFKLEHLPVSLREPELLKFIKITSDLTVRVTVQITSPNRPEFWPDQPDKPYPLYDMRGSKSLRTGTGRIWNVKMIKDGTDQFGVKSLTACWCRKCEIAKWTSSQWYEIEVDTATHVIYDEVEGNCTSVRLFFDEPKCPVVILDQVSLVSVNVEKDCTLLRYITCDPYLGEKINSIWEQWDILWRNLGQRFKDSRDVHKTVLIVSHPHGFSKQISVGQWVDKVNVGGSKYNYSFTYTTPTCPGSSGAPVYILGYSIGWGEHSHSGSIATGMNFCGFGYVA